MAKYAMPQVAGQMAQIGENRRRMRRPAHTFHLEHKPYVIQPFMIAPVLPGETLQNLLLQSRAITDPIKNPLIGWHLEYYFFYVKHRDLAERDEFTQMMLDPSWDDSNVDAAASSDYTYTYIGGIDWVELCLRRVIDCYFRDDDEDYTNSVGQLSGTYLAHVGLDGWWDSLTLAADMTTEDVQVVDPAGTDVLYASEVAAAMRQWELLRAGNLTNQSYEEYLATYGIRPEAAELHIPELIRYVREWQYPSNTIDPSDGSPTSAVSWAVAERADKARFFREPGFIFGVTVARPKVYTNMPLGAGVGMLGNVFSWLPAVLSDDPMTSFRHFADAAGAGPFGAQMGDNNGYWVDVKDLFMYGDQFLNFARTQGTADGLRNVQTVIVSTSAERRYVGASGISSLFVTATTAERVRQDGIVTMSISTTLQDTSHGIATQAY